MHDINPKKLYSLVEERDRFENREKWALCTLSNQ